MTKLLGIFIAIFALLATTPVLDAAQIQKDRTLSHPMISRGTAGQGRIMRTDKTVVSKRRSTTNAKKMGSSDKEKKTSHNRRDDLTTKKDATIKRSTPTTSASTIAREAKQPLQFIGKPKTVAHDPTHQATDARNDLGNVSDHKDVTIKRDDHYFRRSYYFSPGDGGVQTWYWYDTPIGEQDVVVTSRATVPICEDGSDICQYAAGYTPVVVNTCGTNRDVKNDSNGLSHAKISCFSRDGDLSCNGTCHVIDPSDADQGEGPVDAGAGSGPPNTVMYSYHCQCK